MAYPDPGPNLLNSITGQAPALNHCRVERLRDFRCCSIDKQLILDLLPPSFLQSARLTPAHLFKHVDMPRRRRDSESPTALSTKSSSPPVSRDGFFYDGHGLFVEVDSNKHYREDSDSLYALLTHVDPPPVYTKSGTLAKRQPPPFKDRPGHFYRAQLVHYGLKPVTVKKAAKGLLLSAFDQDNTLAVPNNILRLEADLKAQFEQKDKVTEAGGNKKAVSDSFVRKKKLKQAPDQELFEEIMALGPDVALPNPDTITVEEVLEEVVKMSNDRVAGTLSTSVDPEEVLDILPDIMARYKIKTNTSEEDREEEEEEILQARRVPY